MSELPGPEMTEEEVQDCLASLDSPPPPPPPQQEQEAEQGTSGLAEAAEDGGDVEDLNAVAARLAEAQTASEAHKAENSQVCQRQRELNKVVSEVKRALVEAMTSAGCDSIDVGERVFKVTSAMAPRHDLDALKEVVGDPEQFEEYLRRVSRPTSRVACRRKRAEGGESARRGKRVKAD